MADTQRPSETPAVSALWWRRGDGLRLVTAGAACVVLGVVVTWLLPYAGVPMRTGPLAHAQGDMPLAAAPDPRTVSYGYAAPPRPVGHRFTYGTDVLTMPPGSDDSAVIQKVEPLGLHRGLRFLGAMLGSPDRGDTWSRLEGWPPKQGRLHGPVPLKTPITSRSVDRRGWELYLGFQITRPGYYDLGGWRITYEVNGRTYRYVVPARVAFCTPRAARGRFCPLREEH